MKATTRNRLYTIDRTVRKVLQIVTVVLFVLLILATLNTPWKRDIACVFFGLGAFWALLIVCRLFVRQLMEYIQLFIQLCKCIEQKIYFFIQYGIFIEQNYGRKQPIFI